MTDTTIIKYTNKGSHLLQNWNIRCNDKNNKGNLHNFIRSTKMNSPTGDSGATTIPPSGNSFMYIETSANNGNNTVVSFEKTDIIQITNISFYFNRYSSSNQNFRSMGRFRIQLLLNNISRSTRYYIPKIDRYNNSPTQWTLVNLNSTVENYGIK